MNRIERKIKQIVNSPDSRSVKINNLLRLAFLEGIDLSGILKYLESIKSTKAEGLANDLNITNFLIATSITESKERWWEYEPKTKYPKGFFKDRTPTSIANTAVRLHGGDYNAAIRSLVFYKNRAGKNFSPEIRKKIDKAVKIIQKRRDKKKNKKNKK